MLAGAKFSVTILSIAAPKRNPAPTSNAVHKLAEAAFSSVNRLQDISDKPTGKAPTVRKPLGYR